MHPLTQSCCHRAQYLLSSPLQGGSSWEPEHLPSSHGQEVRWCQDVNPDLALKPRLLLLHQVGYSIFINNTEAETGNTDLRSHCEQGQSTG